MKLWVYWVEFSRHKINILQVKRHNIWIRKSVISSAIFNHRYSAAMITLDFLSFHHQTVQTSVFNMMLASSKCLQQ